jgi:hypothetical protein
MSDFYFKNKLNDFALFFRSSYLTESHRGSDTCEMPNLCRRARHSPQNSLLASTSNQSLSTSTSIQAIKDSSPAKLLMNIFSSSSNTRTEFDRAVSDSIQTSKERITWYTYIKSLVSSSSSTSSSVTNTTAVGFQSSNAAGFRATTTTATNNSKLNKNLLHELDADDNHSNAFAAGISTAGIGISTPASSSTNTYNLRQRQTLVILFYMPF